MCVPQLAVESKTVKGKTRSSKKNINYSVMCIVVKQTCIFKHTCSKQVSEVIFILPGTFCETPWEGGMYTFIYDPSIHCGRQGLRLFKDAGKNRVTIAEAGQHGSILT